MNERPPAFPAPGNPPPNDGLAVASLCCGIVSVLCLGALTGVPAIICGHISRGKIARSGGTLGGAGMALAGLILGYVSLVLTVLATLAALAIPSVKGAMKKGHHVRAVNQCVALKRALDDYAAEYWKYPPVPVNAEGEADNAAVVAVLRGEDKDHKLNPRRVIFLEWNPKDIVSGQVVDPWKRPLHISLGTGGSVEAGVGRAAGTPMVWSSGPNGINEHGSGDDIVPIK